MLVEQGYEVDDRVLHTISSDGWLSARLLTSTTPDLASKLYDTVRIIPRSLTRAEVLGESGVIIDGLIQYGACQDGTVFLHAFLHNRPRFSNCQVK